MNNKDIKLNIPPILIPSLIDSFNGAICRQMMSNQIGLEKIRDENPLKYYIEDFKKLVPEVAKRFPPTMFTELHILLNKEGAKWSAYALFRKTWRSRKTHHLTVEVESDGKTFFWVLYEELDSEFEVWYSGAEEKLSPIVRELRDYLTEVTPITCEYKETSIIVEEKDDEEGT